MTTNRALALIGLTSVAAAAPVLPPLLARWSTGRPDWSDLAATWHVSLAIAGGFACVAIAGLAIVWRRWPRERHPLPLLLFGCAVLFGLIADLSLWGFASLSAYLLIR